MTKVLKRCLSVVAAASIFVGSHLSAEAQDKIKIGFHYPQTGFAAADGQSALAGAKLAIDQVNRDGGINGAQVELVSYDDQASADEAVPIAHKLIEQDKVTLAVSGSYSAPTRAAATVFQEAKIPYISAYAIHPDITKAGDYVFRTAFLGEIQGRAGAKLIGKDLGHKRVVLITLKNDFGKSLAAGFKEVASKFGIEIVAEYEYGMKDRQFGPVIAKVKSDNPDAVYASGYYFNAGPLVTQLRAAGVDVPVIGQEGYDSQEFISIAGKAAEGTMITTSLDRDSDAQATRSFIEAYEAAYSHKVDMVAASAHTAVMVAVDAMRKAKSQDGNTIRDTIAATHLSLATGDISFNKQREILKDVQVQIVKDGAWHRHSVMHDPELFTPPEL